MQVSNTDYECAKKWFEIFDDVATHLAEGLERGGAYDEFVKTAFVNTLSMRDELKVTIQIYEEGLICES